MSAPFDSPSELNRFQTIILVGVGGQMLTLIVRQLARRLLPIAADLRLEEYHGVAQRGGMVTARLDLALRTPTRSHPSKVLLALEWIEGARALGALAVGDAAFIARGISRPPGPHRDHPAPQLERVQQFADESGVKLVVVDAPIASPWSVAKAAIDGGAIP